MSERVTQRDVANAAGVSYGTVSLALRNNPIIAVATRERIAKIAREIGYVPDPALAKLAAYRTSRRPAAYHSNVGFITAIHLDRLPRESVYRMYFNGAQQRFRELGYGLEELCLEDVNHNPERLKNILRAKGITGIMIAPGEGLGEDELHMDFSSLSAIRFGYSYRHPVLHTVVNAQFKSALTAMEKAIRFGHKRIGIILNHALHIRTSGYLLGGFRAAQESIPKVNRIEPLFYDNYAVDEGREQLVNWLTRSKIDCVIGCRNYHLLGEAGVRVPEVVSYIELDILPTPSDRYLSGVRQCHEELGVAAANFLSGMLLRGEVGIPTNPNHFNLEGLWVDGRSLADKAPEGLPGASAGTLADGR